MYTAVEKQSPAGVGMYSERRWSAMDTAVEAAEERPHFLIRAPPRLATWAGARAGRGWAGVGYTCQRGSLRASRPAWLSGYSP